MIRALLLVAIIGLVMALMGWLTFQNSGDSATIVLNKQQVKKDTDKAVEKVKELSQDLQNSAEKAFDNSSPPAPAAATSDAEIVVPASEDPVPLSTSR